QLRLTKVDSVAELGKVQLTVDTDEVPPYRCTIEVAGPESSDPDKRQMNRGTPKPPPMGGPKKSLGKPAAKAEPQPKTTYTQGYKAIIKKYELKPEPLIVSALIRLDANRDGNKTEGLCDAAIKALQDAQTKDTAALKKEKDQGAKLRISKSLFDLRKFVQTLKQFSEQCSKKKP